MHDLYAEELPYVTHRTDLNFLLSEMTSELNAGHAYVGGGEMSSVDRVPIGLLGAELEFDQKAGMYKFKKIYDHSDQIIKAGLLHCCTRLKWY